MWAAAVTGTRTIDAPVVCTRTTGALAAHATRRQCSPSRPRRGLRVRSCTCEQRNRTPATSRRRAPGHEPRRTTGGGTCRPHRPRWPRRSRRRQLRRGAGGGRRGGGRQRCREDITAGGARRCAATGHRASDCRWRRRAATPHVVPATTWLRAAGRHHPRRAPVTSHAALRGQTAAAAIDASP